jgi:hypothetical protein
MDHGASRRFADPLHIEMREDDGKRGSAVARRGDPLADGRDEDAIEVRLGDRAFARGFHLGDDRERTWFGISEKADERRQHHGPSLALCHPLRGAERREAYRRGRSRNEVATFDERLERTAERARRERQPLRRDRGKQRGRPGGARGKALEEIQPEERRGESGRGWANRRSPSDGVA